MGVYFGECPNKAFPRQAGLHMAVIKNVLVIIKVDKLMMAHLPENYNGGQCQSHANQKHIQFVVLLLHQLGNNLDLIKFIFAKRYFIAVFRQPKPYLRLGSKFMEEASAKYRVGQLTSAI